LEVIESQLILAKDDKVS